MKYKFDTFGKNEDGQDVELKLAIQTPSGEVKRKATLYRGRAWKEAKDAGLMTKKDLDVSLRADNKWDDQREVEYQRLRKSLLDGEWKLKEGGIRLSEAKRIALQMSRDRTALQALMSERNELEANTVEAFAEQAEFNFMVAACTVYDSGRFAGKPYFTTDGVHPSVDVYLERNSEQVAIDASNKFAELRYGVTSETLDNSVKNLPENAFLLKHKLVDSNLRLINKDGDYVDENGKRVDEDGFYVDESGKRTDAEGRPVDENGQYVVESKPFLDDDDNPIVEELATPTLAEETVVED